MTAGLVALLLPRPASAQPEPFSFEWKAPASCPAPAFVLGEMARLLGHAPGLAADPPVSVHAMVALTGGTYTVRILLTTAEGRGERTFRNASCERVALATALVASLAIDPEAVTAHTSEPPPAAPSRPPPPPSPPPDTPVPARRGRRFAAGVESGVTLGILPDAGARVSVVLGLSWRSFRYEIAGQYDDPQYVPALGQTTRGARLQLDTLDVRACLAPIDGRIEVDACVSTEAGWFLAQGVGISAPESRSYPWAAALAGARLVWRLADVLELRLGADAGAALARPIFQITGSYPTFVYKPSPFVGAGTVGAVVRFR